MIEKQGVDGRDGALGTVAPAYDDGAFYESKWYTRFISAILRTEREKNGFRRLYCLRRVFSQIFS